MKNKMVRLMSLRVRRKDKDQSVPPLSTSDFSIPETAELEAPLINEWKAERKKYLREEALRQKQLAEQQRVHDQRRDEETKRLIKRQQQAEAERRHRAKQQEASADKIKLLRSYIREKYRLDIYVWSKRKVQKANRHIVRHDCAKSDWLLQEIYFIVNAWEEDMFTKEEWKLARKIKESIKMAEPQHKLWADLPPWERLEVEQMM